MLTVVVPAESQDLVEVTTVKIELGITGTAEDRYLQGLVRRVSDDIRRRCGQHFTRETVRETLAGSGSTRLMLSRTPLVSLVSGTIDDGAIEIADVMIDDAATGFLSYDAGWPSVGGLRAPLSGDVIRGGGDGNLVVQYVGGYILPSFPDAAPNLPGSIEEAALILCADRYRNRGRDGNLRSESIGDYSYVLDSGSRTPDGTFETAIDARVNALLRPFMRISV